MKVNYYSISGYDVHFADNRLSDAGADALRRDPRVAAGNYSYTTLRTHKDGNLYVGTTHMGNRILWLFDPRTKKFKDLDYAKVGTTYDIKIHRSLEFDPAQNVFYGVSSGLHTEQEYYQAPGASIFRFDLATRAIDPMGIPLPHEYTQTITFDPQRRLLYGFTYHTFSFYAFNVDRRETVFRALPGSIAHYVAVDDRGGIWSTWGRNQHYLFRYDPQRNDIEWLHKKFPEGGFSYMYPGAGPIDCMVNGGDGFLYVALETGALVRMNPADATFEYLGRPSPYPRMPGLILGPDGLFYGTCGDDGHVKVFSFNRSTRGFTIMADVASGSEHCFRPHDIAIINKAIYVGETDNPIRTGYLWEIDL